MKKHRIGWLPGDGIGVEVMQAARLVLDALELDAEYVHGDIGWEFWCEEGDALPGPDDRAAAERRRGAVRGHHLQARARGRGRARAGAAGQGARLPLADRADAAALRPLRLPAAVQGLSRQSAQLPGGHRPGGLPREHGGPLRRRRVLARAAERSRRRSAGSPRRSRPSPATSEAEYAVSCKINTRQGSERIARAAFEFARKHGRRSVTIVHKANVVRATDGLFLEEAREVAGGLPRDRRRRRQRRRDRDVAAQEPAATTTCCVAPNLYGDIVSDLCAQMVGGLGFGCSGNIGEKLAVFEPTHGSAPKYAGLDKVNPIATILAARMMLDWLGEKEKAERLDAAVAAVIREGAVRTYDMGGARLDARDGARGRRGARRAARGRCGAVGRPSPRRQACGRASSCGARSWSGGRSWCRAATTRSRRGSSSRRLRGDPGLRLRPRRVAARQSPTSASSR